VNGAHDLGGAHGFGPVPIDPDEPVFHEDWERRLFGLKSMLNGHRIPLNLDQGRYDVETLPPDVYFSASYYERWLLAAEKAVVRAGVLQEDELVARRREVAEDPEAPLPSNRDDELADRAAAGVRRGRPTLRETDLEPRFAVGDAVRTRNVHHTGHTRLARYVRGRRGVVVARHGAYDYPERAAAGESQADYVYSVSFRAEELWGETAEPNSSVLVDLFESYLLPA
jgi:nitrile hydratase